MTQRKQMSTAVLAALSGAACLLSISCLIALKSGGEIRIGSVPLIQLAAGYDRAAEPLLVGRSLLQHQDRVRAADLSVRSIKQYPYDTSAWLRLAYVDSLEHGSLTASGLNALKSSYDLVAIDSFVGLWRIRFALENSPSLTPELRRCVRTETYALWRNPGNWPALDEMATSIRNPAGRLSIVLWLNRLRTEARK